MIVTVVAAIIRRGEFILITRRRNDAHLGGLWEFPGGKVEDGESRIDALRREIREELGIEVTVEDEFFVVEHNYITKSVKLHFYNCSVSEGEPRALDVADLRWVTPFELDLFDFPPADTELIERLKRNA